MVDCSEHLKYFHIEIRKQNKKNIFPQSQEATLRKERISKQLVCSTWKVALSLVQIDSDSLNPSRSCPSHLVHSRFASVIYILMPAGLDVCICTKSREETALHKAGRLLKICFHDEENLILKEKKIVTREIKFCLENRSSRLTYYFL